MKNMISRRHFIKMAGLAAVSWGALFAGAGCTSGTVSATSSSLATDEFIDGLTCMIDLHLHLDGALSLKSARDLASLQGIDIPESDEEVLDLIRVSDGCDDLNEFLEKFDFPLSLMQTPEGLRRATSNLLDELHEQGVAYSEIRWAPQLHCQQGMTQEQAIQQVIAGVEDSGQDANLILCLMRGEDTHEANKETVRLAKQYLGNRVVAVDLAGAEALYPTSDYADDFALARELGIPITIHAGEAAGADSVKCALDMGATRIGHGVRCVEDADLVKRLADEGVALTVCPTSNICTAIYEDYNDCVIMELRDAGVTVCVCTDDPGVENTTLKEEYKHLVDAFSLTRADVKAFLENAARASYASDSEKERLLEMIDQQISD